MVAELAAVVAVLVAAVAELWHQARIRRLAPLLFGPRRRPAHWAMAAPVLKVAALGALAWGLTALLDEQPKVHKIGVLPEHEVRHLVLVLDVSPSMRLQDAGPSGQQGRHQRARDVMESFFSRVTVEQYRITVIATYNGAKPVVIDTRDLEVVRNILNDLPMHYAFPVGKTDIFAGLQEAARIAHPWQPRSTTVILVSDGDTVPATGMPKMPAAVSHVLVVGVGDPVTGRFIDGRQSRQDRSTLRQVAVRLGGTYHDGNEKHLSTAILQDLTQTSGESPLQRLTRREYALIAIGLGGAVYALLPLLLHLLGTLWRPGVPAPRPGRQPATEPAPSTSLARVGRQTQATQV